MKKRQIMIVDDDKDMLDSLKFVLETEGYNVVASRGGEDAENLENKKRLPSLLILDMLLSDRDGKMIIKKLRGRQDTKHLPIIMISAYPGAEKYARAAGADDFLSKPFPLEVLLAKINKYV